MENLGGDVSPMSKLQANVGELNKYVLPMFIKALLTIYSICSYKGGLLASGFKLKGSAISSTLSALGAGQVAEPITAPTTWERNGP